MSPSPSKAVAPAGIRVLVPRSVDVQPAPKGALRLKLAGATMATTWSVQLIGPAETDLPALQQGIEALLARIVSQMSPWEPGSDISRFNRLAEGEWQPLPAEFAAVMRCALDVAARSEGAFDPTAGRIVNAWGFGAGVRFDAPGFAPPAESVLREQALGWSRLRLDADGRLLQPGGIALNLSAIAKGFAVDAVASWLGARGIASHLVEIGGELRGSGVKPDLQPWWVEVEAPDTDFTLPQTRIALCSLAVATSGDYRRFVSVNGRRLPHTIDPRTRRPVEHGLASVTVVQESCMWADAWSTAIMVAGPQAGLALAEREGIAALLRWREQDGTWREAASARLSEMDA